jgi:hypothetical protein
MREHDSMEQAPALRWGFAHRVAELFTEEGS